MTIEKGKQWGSPVARPHGLTVLSSDAELAAEYPSADPYGLTGGDVFRSVGSPDPRTEAVRLPIDCLHVSFDDTTTIAVAHVVARRRRRWCSWASWWSGPLVAVCNVDHIGLWNVAPRAHPNDGRFDVVAVSAMPVRERWAAKQRLAQGTHVPHPAISVRSATNATWNFDEAMSIWVDGVDRGTTTSLTVTIEPDALSVIV